MPVTSLAFDLEGPELEVPTYTITEKCLAPQNEREVRGRWIYLCSGKTVTAGINTLHKVIVVVE